MHTSASMPASTHIECSVAYHFFPRLHVQVTYSQIVFACIFGLLFLDDRSLCVPVQCALVCFVLCCDAAGSCCTCIVLRFIYVGTFAHSRTTTHNLAIEHDHTGTTATQSCRSTKNMRKHARASRWSLLGAALFCTNMLVMGACHDEVLCMKKTHNPTSRGQVLQCFCTYERACNNQRFIDQ